MGDRWPPLPEIIGIAVGIVIVVSMAVGVIFIAQSLGASSRLLFTIRGVTSLLAALVIDKALR